MCENGGAPGSGPVQHNQCSLHAANSLILSTKHASAILLSCGHCTAHLRVKTSVGKHTPICKHNILADFFSWIYKQGVKNASELLSRSSCQNPSKNLGAHGFLILQTQLGPNVIPVQSWAIGITLEDNRHTVYICITSIHGCSKCAKHTTEIYDLPRLFASSRGCPWQQNPPGPVK